MAANIINRLTSALSRIEQAIGIALGHRFPPGAIGAFAHNFDGTVSLPQHEKKSSKPFSLKDLVGKGFLWAVPKTRRPLEKRLTRKYGSPDYIWKMLVPKKNLIMCPSCGHDYQASTLCGHCYGRIKKETKEMQEAITNELKLDPVEKEVVVLYEGEQQNKNEEFWKSQRLVEMPKKRPHWFHENLLQSTTQQPSDSKEVKPTELA